MCRMILLPMSPKYVRLLRMAVWNAAFIIAGLLLIALVGEMYLRLANPFLENRISHRFVDGVGVIREPNTEVRYANWTADSFVVSRTNSLGFLDREPVSAERAAAGCHIAFIGDSFVEAREVPIADKFHVRLEDIAARELPRLEVTTQAYGISNIGQINQIPFYDEYARKLTPKLVVLVFVLNDFGNNSTALSSLAHGWDPDRMPFMSAHRNTRGELELRPPDPEFARFFLPRDPRPWHSEAWKRLIRVSYFANWLDIKKGWVVDRVNAIRARIGATDGADQLRVWANIIAERPCCTSLLDSWTPRSNYSLNNSIPFTESHLPPVLEDELEYTAFGIDQFKLRTDHDGGVLAILTESVYMGRQGYPQFERISAIAEARGIPVISQYDYILRQGYDAQDARLYGDIHWDATGHQWAAEAVLEWLKANQEICN